MTEHSTPKARADTFDGDAISRVDREFLASLGDHPLARHPLYSVPYPPRPNYDGCTGVSEMAEAQKACFPGALDWMLVNYAYYADAFMGKGGIISLVDGKMLTIASMRALMQPYAIVEEGPRSPDEGLLWGRGRFDYRTSRFPWAFGGCSGRNRAGSRPSCIAVCFFIRDKSNPRCLNAILMRRVGQPARHRNDSRPSVLTKISRLGR